MSLEIGSKPAQHQGRGVVIFHFGYAYALRLLVCLYSLRQHYTGAVTVFLRDDEAGRELRPIIESLRIDVEMKQGLSQSFDRHRIFLESPYRATLSVDSDTIFVGPIDELWEPMEQHGLLLTRLHAEAFGIRGTSERPGWGNRVATLQGIKSLVEPHEYEVAYDRMVEQGIDVNVGVMGISRPKGDGFLMDWAQHMDRGSAMRPALMDEMLTLVLYHKHAHILVDEKWNWPSRKYFRGATPLADARVIHYFADGSRFRGERMGRNRNEEPGQKWEVAYLEAGQHLDLDRWRKYDPYYDGPLKRFAKFCRKQPKDLIWSLNYIAGRIKKRWNSGLKFPD